MIYVDNYLTIFLYIIYWFIFLIILDVRQFKQSLSF